MHTNQEHGNNASGTAGHSDLPTPAHSFELVMARYKARVYERYAYEIGRLETFACLLPANDNEVA